MTLVHAARTCRRGRRWFDPPVQNFDVEIPNPHAPEAANLTLMGVYIPILNDGEVSIPKGRGGGMERLLSLVVLAEDGRGSYCAPACPYLLAKQGECRIFGGLEMTSRSMILKAAGVRRHPDCINLSCP